MEFGLWYFGFDFLNYFALGEGVLETIVLEFIFEKTAFFFDLLIVVPESYLTPLKIRTTSLAGIL